jgi:hypothetical protein
LEKPYGCYRAERDVRGGGGGDKWVAEDCRDRREREGSCGVPATEGRADCPQGLSHTPLLCSSFDQPILFLLFLSILHFQHVLRQVLQKLTIFFFFDFSGTLPLLFPSSYIL